MRDRQTDKQPAVANIHFASAMPHAKCKKYISISKNSQNHFFMCPYVAMLSDPARTNYYIHFFALNILSFPELFLHGRCPSCHPTNSIKALKETPITNIISTLISNRQKPAMSK